MIICPVHEYNHRHEPAGSSKGGQFAPADGNAELAGPGPVGFTDGYGDAVGDALRRNQRQLMAQSFERDGPVRETMGVVAADGTFVGPVMEGDGSSVLVSPDVQENWIKRGPVVTAHTHPASGPFSLDDFILHNKVNRLGQSARPGSPLTVRAMQVYGEDGSWYEIRFRKVHNDLTGIEAAYREKRAIAVAAANRETTEWAQQQPWFTRRGTDPVMPWEVQSDAKAAGKEAALNAHFTRAFRDRAAPLWSGIAAQFGFEYRYHLAD